MPSDNIELFVICQAGTIEHRGAKLFNLQRLDDTGAAKPFPILVIRTGQHDYVGYLNLCPHQDLPLDDQGDVLFNPDRTALRCSQHGATFDIASGLCLTGPCQTMSLQPVALVVIDGEICLCGVTLVEDDSVPDPFAEDDEMPEVVILND